MPQATFTFPLGIVRRFDENGRTVDFIVENRRGLKDSLTGDALHTKSLEKALEACGDLDVYNQYRAQKSAAKRQVITDMFQRMYGGRGVNLVVADSLAAMQNPAVSAKFAANRGARAAYEADDNTVYVLADQIQNLGQLYTDLAHERSHVDIAEHILGKSGGAETNEEAVAERTSVNEILKAVRDSNRSLPGAVAAWVRGKISEDTGFALDSISDADVRTELKFLADRGYLGQPAEVKGGVAEETDAAALEETQTQSNVAAGEMAEAEVRRKANERQAVADKARGRTARQEQGREVARILAEDGQSEAVPPIDAAQEERADRGADMEAAMDEAGAEIGRGREQRAVENAEAERAAKRKEDFEAALNNAEATTKQEKPTNETGNGADEASAQPEQGGVAGRPAQGEAARPVEGAETRPEAANARVVAPQTAESRAGAAQEAAGARPAAETGKAIPVAPEGVEAPFRTSDAVAEIDATIRKSAKRVRLSAEAIADIKDWIAKNPNGNFTHNGFQKIFDAEMERVKAANGGVNPKVVLPTLDAISVAYHDMKSAKPVETPSRVSGAEGAGAAPPSVSAEPPAAERKPTEKERVAAKKAEAKRKPTEKERVAAKKAEVATKKGAAKEKISPKPTGKTAEAAKSVSEPPKTEASVTAPAESGNAAPGISAGDFVAAHSTTDAKGGRVANNDIGSQGEIASPPGYAAKKVKPVKPGDATAALKAVGRNASQDDTRIALKRVHVEGGQMVATDGRRLVVAPAPEGVADGDYDAKGSPIKPTESYVPYPAVWRQVVPDVRQHGYGKIGEIANGDAAHGRIAFADETAGRVRRAKGGDSAVQLRIGNAGANPQFVKEVVDTMFALGAERLEVFRSPDYAPVVFKGRNAKGEIIGVVMPLRVKGKGDDFSISETQTQVKLFSDEAIAVQTAPAAGETPLDPEIAALPGGAFRYRGQTYRTRAAAEKALAHERTVFRQGDTATLREGGETLTGAVMRTPDGSLSLRVRESVPRSAANPDGVRVRTVPVKDKSKLVKLIDNGGMRFKRGAAVEAPDAVGANMAKAEADSGIRFKKVTDPKVIAEFDAVPHATVYHSGMMVPNVGVVPPMAAKIKLDGMKKPEWNDPANFGDLMEAEEHPELIIEKGRDAGKYPLRKYDVDDTPLGTVNVAYDPYLHMAAEPENPQFTSAWERPAMKVYEYEIAEDDTRDAAEKEKDGTGYRAERAYLSTGANKWPGGRTVYLTRYARLVREMPWSEVADMLAPGYVKNGTVVPWNTVSQEFRDELRDRGVNIGDIEGYKDGPTLERARKAKEEDERRYEAREATTYARRLRDWLSPRNIDAAKILTREEIFQKFGNELEPIATIPEGYLQYLSNGIADNRVYSGKGYLIDHAVNHHPEVATSDYFGIQGIINNADDVKLDDRNPNRNKSLLFIKNIGKSGVVIVSFDEGEDGKIVLHKSFFTKMKKGRFDKLQSVKLSSEVGNPSISHAADATSAVRLSALEDGNSVPQTAAGSQGGAKVTPAEDAAYMDAVRRGDMETARRMVRETAARAMPNTKVVDEDGLPKVVYHGTGFGGFNTFNTDNGGIWLSGTERYSRQYRNVWGAKRPQTYELFANIEKPKDLRGVDTDAFVAKYRDAETGRWEPTEELVELAKMSGLSSERLVQIAEDHGEVAVDGEHLYTIVRSKEFQDHLNQQGFDGIVQYEENGRTETYCAFSPSQVKTVSAETYDDAGNVIPLSQRFNPQREDIRFKVGGIYTGTAADYANRSRQGGVDDGPKLHNIGNGLFVYGHGYEGTTLRKVAERNSLGKKWKHLYKQTFFTNRAKGDESHILETNGEVTTEQMRWVADEMNRSFADNGEKWTAEGNLLVRTDEKGDLSFGPFTGGSLYSFVMGHIHKRQGNDLQDDARLTSELFVRADIDGIKSPILIYGETSADDKAGWNYVAFSDEHIRVDHKWTDGQMRFKIAGERGAANLGITNLGDAEHMEKSGASREDIWRTTGWWRGRDGKWRVEIPDVKRKRWDGDPEERHFTGGGEDFYRYRLTELIEDGDFLKAYPKARDIVVEFHKNMSANVGGNFDEATLTIKMPQKFHLATDWAKEELGDGKSAELNEAGRKTIVHELQHAIQLFEGFAKGGSPTEPVRPYALDGETGHALSVFGEAVGLDPTNDSHLRNIANWAQKITSDYTKGDVPQRIVESFEAAAKEAGKTPQEFRDEIERLYDSHTETPLGQYIRLEGEVEARNVKERLNMTPEARAAIPPWETEDVAEAIQIIRFKSAPRAAVDDPDVLFGARESRKAHGLDDLTAEESRLAYTDKELYAAGQRIAKDVPHMLNVVNDALTSDRALPLEDTFALTVFLRNQMDALADVHAKMQNGNAASFRAEEEYLSAIVEKASKAVARNNTKLAGLRVARLGVMLDTARDTEAWLTQEVRTRRAAQGLPPEPSEADKAMIKRMAEQLKKANEENEALRKQIADLQSERVTERRAKENVAKGKSAAKRQTLSPERRAKAKAVAGITLSDNNAAGLAKLESIFGKSLSFKGGASDGILTDEMAQGFAALLEGHTYDEIEKVIKSQMPKAASAWAEFRRQNEKKLSAAELANLALPVTDQRLVTTKDLGEAREEAKRKLDENAGDPYQQRIAIGHYLRRYMDALINENPDVPMKELQEKMAEEATALTGTKHDPVAMLAVMAGVDGYDLETRAEIQRKIAKAQHALDLFRQGKVNEAARESGLLYEDEATALEQMENALRQIITEKADEIDYLSTFSEKNAEAVERVKQLKADLKEANDALKLMRKEISLAERKAKFAEVLEKRIAEAQQAADALRGEVESEDFTERKARAEAKIAELKAALAVAKRDENTLKRIKDKIAEYEKRIADGDYDRALQTYRANDADLQAKLALARERRNELRRKLEAERRNRNYRQMGVVGKTLYGLVGILGEMKGIVASFDLSSVLRQGGQLTWAHPFLAAKNLKETLKAWKSADYADNLMAQLRMRPNWKYYEQAGIDFTDWGEGATNKEDVYLLNQYRRITNNKLLKKGVMASERAFSMFLNLMRADVFDAMANGSTFGSAANMNDSQMKALGRFINIATQRGAFEKGGKFANAIPALNTVLWSPRNVASRFQFLWETGKLLGGGAAYGDKTLRKLFAQELVRYIGGMSAAAMFLKAVAELFRDDDDPPNETEFDPRSSDFLKVRFGNVRMDLTSGLTPILVFGARMFSGKTMNTRGQMRESNRLELMGRFARQKFAPAASLVYDMGIAREDFERRDIDYTSLWEQDAEHVSALRYFVSSFAPLSGADLLEQAEVGGLPKTFVTGAMSLLGANVQAFDPYNFKQLKGDYTYFRRLYDESHDPEERRHLVEYHPMLKRRERIEAVLKRVRNLENIKKKAEKSGQSRPELDERIKEAKEIAIGVMAGID